MVKPVKERNTILLTFQACPPTSTVRKGISRPVRLIPKRNRSFVAREPVSPRVSCLGQVKCTQNKKRSVFLKKPKQQPSPDLPFAEQIKTKVLSRRLKGTKRGHDHTYDGHGPVLDEIVAPSLQKMRHFSTARGRETLSEFDW